MHRRAKAMGPGSRWFVTLLSVNVLLVRMSEAAYRPNIIMIVADDMGFNDVSFHGSNEIPTPNIDALAYNGVILNQHYVQPLCTPSRAALMTGMYPIHLGMQGLPILAPEPRALPAGPIVPEYLQQLGYVTAGVGKWHLGYHRSEFLPTRRGFDSFMGYYNGYVSYYDYIAEFVDKDGNYLSGFDLRRNESLAWDLQGRYATDVFTDEAVNTIRRHDPRAPLFLYLAHLGVHAGNSGKLVEAPQEEIDKFRHIADPNRRTYAAMVSKLDQSVGRVVAALQSRGMLDNSIIVFMSDNGAPTVGPYQNWGSNAPLRGVKETLWEGGVRGAALVWSPLIYRRPRVSFELMHITDWLPTLYTAAGGSPVDLPPDLDGVDQWASITTDLPSRRSEILLNIDEKARTAAIRQNNWKLVIGTLLEGKYDRQIGSVGSPSDPPFNFSAVATSLGGRALASHGARTGWPATREFSMANLRARATVRCGPSYGAAPCEPGNSSKPCLFDISNDPCERNNLADLYPTVARALKRSLVAYRKGLVPQAELVLDMTAADPRRFGGAWKPWSDSAPPPTPPKKSAEEDKDDKPPQDAPAAQDAAVPDATPEDTDETAPATDSNDKDSGDTDRDDAESAY